MKDDARVIVYDKTDVWELDPAGVTAPINLTAGAGKQTNVTYRLVDLDRDEPALDPTKPMLLRALNNETKESGYYRDKFGAASVPEKLIAGPRAYNALAKARKAETYMMTQSTYREYPDLYVGTSIGQVSKVTNANAQENEYPRGDVELVSWLSDDGVKLQGMLYTPENFDPKKKYPMVSYFYEKLSDGLHGYVAPSGRNNVNPLVYTSQGYLVFFPDVVYTMGYPGPSAYKCIVSGVKSLIERGFVDPKRLGLNGQSWGGYETAYIITQTSMFAAAVPNASVVNMTSAYGGIRWESGIARTGQYEHGQSRIGGSLWQYPERYILNSPLFQMDRVTTPIMWMENDADGAVPWYQGIEYYLAMRRLKKEAYMVVYNGEGHNPSKRANQKDIDMKMQQFFANKLMGAPAPEWMTKGIPNLEKSRDQVKMSATKSGSDVAPIEP
jgi:dipeptidyl aminopeptidase/acylaminoacyl peptidase